MSGFPSLEPVLTAHLELGLPRKVGPVASGAPLTVVPFVGGTLKSLPGAAMPVDAKLIHGLDYSRADPSQKLVRLEVNIVWENSNGSLINFAYNAMMDITPEIIAIMSGSETAKSTDFGNIFATINFETGDETLKDLESSHFIGSGRFIVEPGLPLAVEYMISKVIK